MKLGQQKSPEEVLQEEFLREKAQVLGRAGESLAQALDKLRGVECAIEGMLFHYRRFDARSGDAMHSDTDILKARKTRIGEINGEISRYNALREYAKIRFYYLIVIREAMGMRRHERVEEMFRIPPSKKYLRD